MKMPQKINTISDLKKINFGQSVPEESLRLLHWFANIVNIDNNNVIWLTFDPDNHDYGSHLYHNSERLLNPLPEGQQYYTIGNVNANSSEDLPDYVVNWMDNTRRNTARVIIRVREESRGTTVHQVYITQHYETFHYRDTRYDPEHTYHVTTNLLRLIRNLSVGKSRSLTEVRNTFGSNIDDSELRDIRTTWGDLASLGLLLFIVMPEKYSGRYSNRAQTAPRRTTQPHVAVEMPENRQIVKNAHVHNECNECVSDCDSVDTAVCQCFIIIIVVATILLFLYFNR